MRAGAVRGAPRRAQETRRHLHAGARAARRAALPAVRARPVQHALRLRRRRGADLDQRRPRPSRSSLVHTIRAVGRDHAAPCAAAAGRRASACAARSARPGRSTRRTASDVVLVAGGIGLAPLRPAHLPRAAPPRRTTGESCCSTARARRATSSSARSCDEWRGALRHRTSTSRSTAPTMEWHGHVGVVTTLIPRAPFDPQQHDRVRLRSGGDDALRRSRPAAARRARRDRLSSRWSAT